MDLSTIVLYIVTRDRDILLCLNQSQSLFGQVEYLAPD